MRRLFLFTGFLLSSSLLTAQRTDLFSPDRKIQVTISATDEALTYAITRKGEVVLAESPLAFEFTQSAPIEKYLRIEKEERKTIDETWKPVVAKHSLIRNHCNELTLTLREKKYPCQAFRLIFRAYNDGVAFRFYFDKDEMKQNDLHIRYEKTTYHFPGDYQAWMANVRDYSTDNEEEYFPCLLSSITEKKLIAKPLVVKMHDSLYVALAESDELDYPVSFVSPAEKTSGGILLHTKLAPLPGQNEYGIKASRTLPFATPWRVIMAGSRPGDLVESEIIMNLATPSQIKETSWIKPGICTWDNWWCCGVKMDTETNKKFIQLAADMGYPYQLIDWKWYGDFDCPEADITTPALSLDLQEVLRFAREKGVRCWLWLHYNDAIRQYEKAFPLYEQWGIAGVKIDFWRRQDQEMMRNYEKIAKKAAEHHLMLNFHSPCMNFGIERTYPNVMTREGVLGNEYYNWSTRITPEHNTTIPFTRMLMGPLDITPGGMLNRTPETFRNQHPTLVMNTRAAELAKFVVFFSPITTLADHPDHYINQAGVDFMKAVPADADEMKVLAGEIGEYIVMAKRKGEKWFLGALNNSDEREVEISCSFLPAGTFSLQMWADGPEANKDATRLSQSTIKITAKDRIKIHMARAGGWAAIATRK